MRSRPGPIVTETAGGAEDVCRAPSVATARRIEDYRDGGRPGPAAEGCPVDHRAARTPYEEVAEWPSSTSVRTDSSRRQAPNGLPGYVRPVTSFKVHASTDSAGGSGSVTGVLAAAVAEDVRSSLRCGGARVWETDVWPCRGPAGPRDERTRERDRRERPAAADALRPDRPQLVPYLPGPARLADGLEGLGASDGLADVVAGRSVLVLGVGCLSGPGASGFGNTGGAGEVSADVPEPSDPGRGEPVGGGGPPHLGHVLNTSKGRARQPTVVVATRPAGHRRNR